jgi:hypothetical protein
MKLQNLFITLFSILILGCSSPGKKLKTSFNPETEGMIVGTICIDKKIYNEYKFIYGENISSYNDIPNNTDEFSFRNDHPDYKKKGKTYFLFNIIKPAKEYKFFKLKIFNNSRVDQNFIEIPLYFPFEVVKGKITYFGQLTINTKKKIYKVENQLERDRKLFAKKRPQIKF